MKMIGVAKNIVSNIECIEKRFKIDNRPSISGSLKRLVSGIQITFHIVNIICNKAISQKTTEEILNIGAFIRSLPTQCQNKTDRENIWQKVSDYRLVIMYAMNY